MTAVYDGESTITVYQDGDVIGTGVVGGPPPANESVVNIGDGWHGNNEGLDGMLDEVALFRVALTEAEVERLMEAGLKEGLLSVEPAGKLTTRWGELKVM